MSLILQSVVSLQTRSKMLPFLCMLKKETWNISTKMLKMSRMHEVFSESRSYKIQLMFPKSTFLTNLNIFMTVLLNYHFFNYYFYSLFHNVGVWGLFIRQNNGIWICSITFWQACVSFFSF